MTEETATIPAVPMIGLKTLWIQVAGTLCNLTCNHCFISCGPTVETHKMMPRDEVKRHIDDFTRGFQGHNLLPVGDIATVEEMDGGGSAAARGHCVPDPEIYFTGGEPFMHKEIVEILGDALAVAPTTVLTNGTLLSDEIVGELARLRDAAPHDLEIRISLDGPGAQTNDRIRGQGAFHRAGKGMQRLIAAGFEPILSVTPSGAGDPAEEVKKYEDLLARLGSVGKRVKVIPVLLIGAAEKSRRPYAPDERVTEACFETFPIESLQCASCRMVTSEGVFVCPILINEPAARMGDRIEDTLRPFPLAHQACYTCRTAGLTCGN